MEMCHHLPNTNVDEVMNALKMCNKRIISDKYLSGGMGDGGGCHPRDNIALSWLSDKLDMSFNWFDNIMKQREVQTDWLADIIEYNKKGKVVILGKSFKPETNIETGSPAHLLANILRERNISFEHYDPYVDGDFEIGHEVCTFFIATKHEDFNDIDYPKGSVIIDPWRYIGDKQGVEVIRIGERNL
jgi:UDPglucose 6-dehydrogenase